MNAHPPQPGPQLPPFPMPLGLYPAFIAQGPETLVLKEKVFSLSGDTFSVTTIDGRPILQIQGEYMSLSDRKHVLDPQGMPLFDLRKEHFKLHTTYYAEGTKGERLLEVVERFQLVGSKQLCTFTAPDGGSSGELVVQGDFMGKDATITEATTGQVVAHINRQIFNMRQIFGDSQTYHVTVAQNVDLVLVAAMCVCLDELREKD